VLTEQRRAGLEKYLLAILTSSDARWRETPAWRQFLNLPSSWVPSSNSAASIANNGLLVTGGADAVTDPTLWLDRHRELKGLLHDARNFINAKESAKTPTQIHEAGTGAKKCLIRAGGLINSLERGLKTIESGNGQGGLGEGELRRRRDLLTNARSERDTLETLSSATTKRMASFTPAAMPGGYINGTSSKPAGRSGRVLGGPPQETERTRELDNQGLVVLQKDIMNEQDQDLEELLKLVRRQKEIGLAIGEEVEIQNVMLNQVNEDVDRHDAKMRIAKKKMDKIS
jgi:regulator of vacuolar morphogenesis